MNAEEVLRELELAAWESAEAESHERAAKALRLKSTKRISSVHQQIKEAQVAFILSKTKHTP